ncbi:hypothetical protein HELRODRAFT_89874 [Helobdella robusta]|uniref:Timeless N-terminal domain-containing protein n=1 Tax=Helobdella robusta TaxID=6412 RepID=T1G7I6_HELRO|nr:hypothetical protein HELRODRAFT_89874 [Helobdella robusta]ESN92145.1 hypothetical protein HELRODRAFT_89874 [Helobdella robusta]
MSAELQATCASLGYSDEDGHYQREPDCLESIKDLIRFLKRDDETCSIRRQLGSAAILQNDLIPILKLIGSNLVFLETVLRLLVNLTQPACLCFREQIPDDKLARQNLLEVESYLLDYKESFVDEVLFSILSTELGNLLQKEWSDREEEDRMLIERIVLLVRNVLLIPTDLEKEQRTDDDASIHDQILWSLHSGGFIDLLLYIASSDDERALALHVLEITSLIFMEQTPDQLASCGTSRPADDKAKDTKELELMLDKERHSRRASILKCGSRHSRFGGTFQMKDFKSISDRDFIFEGVFKMNLSKGKVGRRKAKNRRPIAEAEVVRRSTFVVRSMLKEFCVQFLENCYNPLMRVVKDALIRSKAQENDESYYFKVMTFIMHFNRKFEFKSALVGETLSITTFHYVTTQLIKYHELVLSDKKDAIIWSKRMHLALRAYNELLQCIMKMDQSDESSVRESSRVIKSNIFYTMEYRDLFLLLLKKYDVTKQSRQFLQDLLEANHVFVRMLELTCRADRHLVIQRKKRRIRRRRRKKKKETTMVEKDEGDNDYQHHHHYYYHYHIVAPSRASKVDGRASLGCHK